MPHTWFKQATLKIKLKPCQATFFSEWDGTESNHLLPSLREGHRRCGQPEDNVTFRLQMLLASWLFSKISSHVC